MLTHTSTTVSLAYAMRARDNYFRNLQPTMNPIPVNLENYKLQCTCTCVCVYFMVRSLLSSRMVNLYYPPALSWLSFFQIIVDGQIPALQSKEDKWINISPVLLAKDKATPTALPYIQMYIPLTWSNWSPALCQSYGRRAYHQLPT